jgi:uncharacterized protein (UPF0332 family)
MKPNTLRKLSSQFVSMSQTISDNDLKEGLFRASIDKSYYYAFLVIREAMTAIGINITKTQNAHSQVIEKLKELNGPLAVACSRELKSLRDQRNDAIYNLSKKIDETDANTLILEASKLLEKLAKNKSIGTKILNYI